MQTALSISREKRIRLLLMASTPAIPRLGVFNTLLYCSLDGIQRRRIGPVWRRGSQMRECCTVSAGEGEHPLSSETHTIRRYSDIRVIRITLWLFLRVSLVQQRGVDLDP